MLPRFTRITALIAAAITLLFLASCGSTSDTPNVIKTSEKQEVASGTAVSVDGAIIPIKDFDSQPTVLWFWAPN